MKKYLVLILILGIGNTLFSQTGDTIMQYSLKLIRQQKFAKAIPYLQEYSKQNPDHLNSKLQLAFCFTQTGQLNKSIKLYKSIVAQRAAYDRGYYMLANLYLQKQAFSQALNFVNKALSFDKSNADYLLAKAQILRQQGKMDEACQFYKKAKRKGSSEAKRSLKKYCR